MSAVVKTYAVVAHIKVDIVPPRLKLSANAEGPGATVTKEVFRVIDKGSVKCTTKETYN